MRNLIKESIEDLILQKVKKRYEGTEFTYGQYCFKIGKVVKDDNRTNCLYLLYDHSKCRRYEDTPHFMLHLRELLVVLLWILRNILASQPLLKNGKLKDIY
jgi:hypothetical protein